MSLVEATNFGGYDEWLIVHLTSTGRFSIPYANRPLELFWDMPAPLLFPHRLEAYLWLHAAYLWLIGVLVWAAFRRLVPAHGFAALAAGAFAATWAPRDSLRLNAVETVAYSGVTFVALAAAAVLWVAWRRRSLVLFAAAALLAALAVRTYESVVPLLAAAPALFWAGARVPEERARRVRWAGAWVALVALSGLAAVAGVVAPAGGSYQMSALRLDPSPAGLASRLAVQAWFHLWPAVSTAPGELASASVAVVALVFVAGALPLAWSEPGNGPARWEPRGALAGLLLAVLGWSVFCLSPAIRTAERTQFLSAPGVAVLLTSVLWMAARPLPRRLRAVALLAATTWIVAVGAGRTRAMQAHWDATTLWPAQAAALREVLRVVPDVAPGTLVVLFDEPGAWPATFTFRHALQYLYDGRATGHVVGARDFLYPTQFTDAGAWTAPLPEIREAWRAPVTLHRGAEIVALSLRADGTVELLETWPAALPPAAGAGYAPRARVVPGARRPASRAILGAR